MTVRRPPSPMRPRAILMAGAALCSLCTALPTDRADAQAFAATPTTVAGNVTYYRATPGIETVQVNSDSAIIAWNPPPSPTNPYVFLPAGNVATFQNGVNNANFVVLNQLLLNVPIRFDGQVISQLVGASGTTRGGTVLFSNPGGIIVGSTAIFDVGNLVLTTLTVNRDGAGNFYDPATRGYTFASGRPPAGSIVTEAGSQIRALAPSSYVAFVAPAIQHAGSVRVNGSAAYVAGEQVQLRANQGLFDIIVDVGTDNVVPISHSGTTGGPASSGAVDPHNIYMVAVPKTQAISMLLSGSMGYDAPLSASIENGAIVLSSGFNVVAGAVDRYGELGAGPALGAPGASLTITNASVTSDLFGYAATNASANAFAGAPVGFSQDVSLFAGAQAQLFAGAGATLSVGGNAIVSAAALDTEDPAVVDLTGGVATISADKGGTINIAGNATVDASARGHVNAANVAGSGTGGSATVGAFGGTVRIGGRLDLLATGTGGFEDAPTENGGNGRGGSLTILADGAGSAVTVGGATFADASGTGSASNGNLGTPAASGRGGDIDVIALNGGGVTLRGASHFAANGTGGALNAAAGVGGSGTAGTINVGILTGSIDLGPATQIDLIGLGGVGAQGGTGSGGQLLVEATDGTIALGNTLDVAATATGGNAFVGGRGGDATGGSVTLASRGGPTPSRVTAGASTISTAATGGLGGGAGATPGGRGGDGRGGTIALSADATRGTLALGAVRLDARGIGGAGGDTDKQPVGGGRGGDGFGGSITAGTVAVVDPGCASPAACAAALTGSVLFASLDATGNGVGGAGGFGAGAGGNGRAGAVTLSAVGAPTTVTGLTSLAADGIGGLGGDNGLGGRGGTGNGTGGALLLNAAVHPLAGIAGGLTLATVNGTASATGAAATPGSWRLAVNGGTIALANATFAAAGTGTLGAAPDSSFDARNGTISVSGTGAFSTTGSVTASATGTGKISGGNVAVTAGRNISVSHSGRTPTEATIDAANVTLRAGGNATFNAGSRTHAGTRLDVQANLITVADLVSAPDIRLASLDIDVPAGGFIGDSTTLTTLLEGTGTNGASAQTIIGGTANGPGYTLTNAEANRIRSRTLTIRTPFTGGTSPDLLIRDLALSTPNGAAGPGINVLDVGTAYRLSFAGRVQVEGNLSLANAGANDGILIETPGSIRVITPGGSIRVHDAAGAPTGTLRLTSNAISVASQPVLTLIDSGPADAARDAALNDNGGTQAPRGYIEAGGVTLNVRDSLYVQNTGENDPGGLVFTSPAYGGITVGTGGLTIRATGTLPASVTAFGRRINADGSVTTGDAFFRAVNYAVGPASGIFPFAAPGSSSLSAGFTATSAFNNCIIVTGQCPLRRPNTSGPGGRDPVTGPTGTIQLPPGVEGDDLVDTTFATEPLIEEPVTSGGESTIWTERCDPRRERPCDPVHP